MFIERSRNPLTCAKRPLIGPIMYHEVMRRRISPIATSELAISYSFIQERRYLGANRLNIEEGLVEAGLSTAYRACCFSIINSR